MPSVLEMALVSTKGIVLFSDLSKAATSRISPFYESITRMAIGDNLSLALDTTKTIVASRISKGAVLITVTDKKVGIVLTKMGGVADKFGLLLDELMAVEESKAGAIAANREAATNMDQPSYSPEPLKEEVEPPAPVSEDAQQVTPAIEEAEPPAPEAQESQEVAPVVENIQRSPPASLKPPEDQSMTAETPAVMTKKPKEVEKEQEAGKEVAAAIVEGLDQYTILEAVPKPKTDGTTLDGEMIKFVRLVDGTKTVDAVAKEADVRLDRAMKKLSLLIQEGILKLKYDDPVYYIVPKLSGKLDSELQSMAFTKADLPKVTPDVLKQVDGKKNILTIARELDLEPEKLREVLKTLEKRKMVKL
jgi:hypothetical protein